MSKNNPNRMLGNVIIVAGILLILGALSIVLYNVWDEARVAKVGQDTLGQLSGEISKRAESNTDLQYTDNGSTLVTDHGETVIPNYILNPNMEMPTVNIDGFEYIGVIEIPAIERELPIMSTWSYPQLKIAPCRYVGSIYSKNLVIAGHNYNAHFGELKNLQQGDKVIFTDADGNEFHYIVAEVETMQPTAVSEMKSSGFPLTLFTCTLGGKFRVTVRCVSVD